jgi:hypothetical protein
MRPLHWTTWQLYDLLECVPRESGDVGWQVGTIYELVKKERHHNMGAARETHAVV